MRARILVALAVTGLLLTGPAATTVAAQSTGPVTLTVSVVDQNGETISDAELTATWENGSTTETTASNGRAFIDVERGANVTVSLSHPEYIRNRPFVVRNATERDVTIPAHRRGQLSVAVADDSGDVADARVVLRQNGRFVSQASTDEDGAIASGPIEQGTYTVAVVKPGYFRNTTTVEVGASTRTRIPIERGTVSLTVAVRDPHFSPPRPVSNATVSIASIGQLQTLADGGARVSVPVNTELSITVGKEGYDDVTERVRVEESDLRVNFSANRTPSLRLESINTRVVAGERLGVSVVDEYSEPVEGATVLLDGEAVSSTDADGRAAVTVEEPGNHTLAAEKEGVDSSPVTIRAIPEDGETATPTQTPTATEASPGSGSSTPGFTPLTAILALSVSLAILALRRR
jgi:hypothetical protein